MNRKHTIIISVRNRFEILAFLVLYSLPFDTIYIRTLRIYKIQAIKSLLSPQN